MQSKGKQRRTLYDKVFRNLSRITKACQERPRSFDSIVPGRGRGYLNTLRVSLNSGTSFVFLPPAEGLSGSRTRWHWARSLAGGVVVSPHLRPLCFPDSFRIHFVGHRALLATKFHGSRLRLKCTRYLKFVGGSEVSVLGLSLPGIALAVLKLLELDLELVVLPGPVLVALHGNSSSWCMPGSEILKPFPVIKCSRPYSSSFRVQGAKSSTSKYKTKISCPSFLVHGAATRPPLNLVKRPVGRSSDAKSAVKSRDDESGSGETAACVSRSPNLLGADRQSLVSSFYPSGGPFSLYPDPKQVWNFVGTVGWVGCEFIKNPRMGEENIHVRKIDGKEHDAWR
ncbi:hypothetical protein C8R43DRAFT_953652 [Mycena crocata]|nr:hypothetical protein C8R43DRAFT_953652 [Mycena crocata]